MIAVSIAAVVLLALLLIFSGPGTQKPAPENPSPVVTQAPTDAPTQPPTEPPTEPPTQPPVQIPQPDEEKLGAKYIFVYDSKTSRVLYTRGSYLDKVAPASLTKLLTAYVVLEILDPQQVITVGPEAHWVDPDSSIAYVANGEKLTVEMLIEGMLLQSGNDAAYVLAVAGGRAIANDPELNGWEAMAIFMQRMNARAVYYGLTGSNFVNPDGIDHEEHYTTTADLLIIAKLALTNELICRYSGLAKERVTYASGQVANWTNTNLLLHESTSYYCPAAIGLKTGSTSGAGKCLISAFTKEDGGVLIVGVLGCENDHVRYSDSLLLYNLYK
jgi:D-alanyl-D-alanine carboxypeptidase (penicillin-binding protein 5/6)